MRGSLNMRGCGHWKIESGSVMWAVEGTERLGMQVTLASGIDTRILNAGVAAGRQQQSRVSTEATLGGTVSLLVCLRCVVVRIAGVQFS